MFAAIKGCGTSFVKRSAVVVMGPGVRRDDKEQIYACAGFGQYLSRR
jgi:hypothetical protein